MRTEEYKRLLGRPEWQTKRAAIIAHNPMCALCWSGESLCVHHRYYLPGRAPWDYPESAFVVLCSPCHAIEHAPEFAFAEACKKLRDAAKGKLLAGDIIRHIETEAQQYLFGG